MEIRGFRTYQPKPHEIQRKWYVVDATGKPLGRLASRIALILQGKHKPIYAPHVDCGDGVIVINAEKVVLTGKKWKKKTYIFYSGYPSGNHEMTAEQLRERNIEKLFKLAVKRMLPRNRLRKRYLRRLRIFRGPEHTLQAQKPEPLELKLRRTYSSGNNSRS